MSDSTPKFWYGWLRVPGHRWLRVCSAPTEGLARQRLDAEAAKHQHCDLTVLSDSRDPNQMQRMRR